MPHCVNPGHAASARLLLHSTESPDSDLQPVLLPEGRQPCGSLCGKVCWSARQGVSCDHGERISAGQLRCCSQQARGKPHHRADACCAVTAGTALQQGVLQPVQLLPRRVSSRLAALLLLVLLVVSADLSLT